MNDTFLQHNNFFIDEKVGFFKFSNQYKIFDESGQQIGLVQQKMSFGQKVLRLLLKPAMLPFHIEIQDELGQVVSTITRGWTFWMSKIKIFNDDMQQVATIQQKFKLFKPKFQIMNMQDQLMSEVIGDWKAWDFQITNSEGATLAMVNKKWAGAMKEIFTTADKYHLTIMPQCSNLTDRLSILAATITIDMVLKEKK